MLKVSTKTPRILISEIIDNIAERKIRSWAYDNEADIFYHKGAQYVDHVYFEYEVDDARGIVNFILQSDGNVFAESRAFQLLERMLLAHFESIIKII